MKRTQQLKLTNNGSTPFFHSSKHLFSTQKLQSARDFVHYFPNNRQLNKIKTEPSDQEQLTQLNRNIYKMKKDLFNSTKIHTGKSNLIKKYSLQTDCALPPRYSVIKATKPKPIDQTCQTQRKIRESFSTQCQSPKAEKPVLNRKVMEYRVIKLLGKGRFGQVYMAKHQKTGFLGALKIIRKTHILNQDKNKKQRILTQIISQIKLQSHLNHPNLIKLYNFFSDEDNIYLFQQLASDGQLYQLLQKNGSFSEQTTSMVMRQITAGVQYMHSKSIIHRDIKLENIVFTHGMAKICDFGWSVHETKQFRTTLCGTPLYLSPQILKGRKYNQKIDIWALGNIAHEMATNSNPFGIQKKEELNKIITMDFQMKKGSPELRSYINFILKKNPAKRPDADILLQHPFIRKYAEIDTSEELCNLIYISN